MKTAVMQWFGPAFSVLHPKLQELHCKGGKLQGEVLLEYGHGLAGWLGRRLAIKMGLPLHPGQIAFEVNILHINNQLHWSRRFGDHREMLSVFVPVGNYPSGYWQETTGRLMMHLGVDIREGGWSWVPRQARLGKIPVPLGLFPTSKAYKKIVDDKYEFSVEFSLPLLGKLVSYQGQLEVNIG